MSQLPLLVVIMILVFLDPHVCDNEDDRSPGPKGEQKGLETNGSDLVLVLFISLLLGLIGQHAFHLILVPYTVVLPLFGLLLGLIHVSLTRPTESDDINIDLQGHHSWKRFARGIDIWLNLPPDLLTLVFLPALVFSSAFSIDYHLTKNGLGQVLTLAGIGVVISTGLIAIFVKFAFPYQWCWPKALTFAAILSVTDPSTIVAALKEVINSSLLVPSGTLDGTAFVLFVLFRDLIPVTDDCLDDKKNCIKAGLEHCVEGRFVPTGSVEHHGTGESIMFFLRLAAGGLLVGYIWGCLLTFFVYHVRNNILFPTTITFVSAYLAFYLCQEVLNVSAVLAVVGLGLYMGCFAKARISSPVLVFMQSFWEMIEYLANTLVFVFTGLKIAVELFENHDPEVNWITKGDWLYAILLYVVLQVIRSITLFSLQRWLKRTESSMPRKTWFACFWGSGLRGADTLALALSVQLDQDRLPASFRAYTMFYVGVSVILTLLINGTTTVKVLKTLKVDKMDPETETNLKWMVEKMEQQCAKQYNNSTNKLPFFLADSEMMELTRLDITKIAKDIKETGRQAGEPLNSVEPGVSSTSRQQTSTDIEAQETQQPLIGENSNSCSSENSGSHEEKRVKGDMRRRFYKAVKKSYGEYLERGYINPAGMLCLAESVDEGCDYCYTRNLCDWHYLQRMTKPAAWRFWLLNIKLSPQGSVVGRFFKGMVTYLLRYPLYNFVLLSKIFVEAHKDVRRNFIKIFRTETLSREEMNGSKTDHDALREAVANDICKENDDQLKKVDECLEIYRSEYSELYAFVKKKLHALQFLHVKEEWVKEAEEKALVGAAEAASVRRLLSETRKGLSELPFCPGLDSSRNLLSKHPFFLHLKKQDFDSEVFPHLKKTSFKKGDQIFGIGENATKVFFLIKGEAMSVSSTDKEIRIYENPVTLLGVTEVLLDVQRKRKAICKRCAQSYEMDKTEFLKLLDKFQPIRQRAWQMTALLLSIQEPWGNLKGRSPTELFTAFTSSKLIELEKGQQVPTEDSHAYLVRGTVIPYGRSACDSMRAPVPLTDRTKSYKADTEVKIIKIPNSSLSTGSTFFPHPGANQPNFKSSTQPTDRPRNDNFQGESQSGSVTDLQTSVSCAPQHSLGLTGSSSSSGCHETLGSYKCTNKTTTVMKDKSTQSFPMVSVEIIHETE